MKKYIFIVLFFILVIAAITVPDKQQYTEWIKDQVKKESNDSLINFGVDLLGSSIISSATTCKNYVFVSYCNTKLIDSNTISAIGIFHNYFGFNSQ
ncbi:hypothetical protein [Paenibacillus dokdonensis]|uniref:hypothetical protein n=1 Tax=Paenibacillus dokdonensis TaxID=2567944 RepID=UPI0010A76230|nr:hypothetical protein [Paenibacillus dokdonensis]